MNIIDVAAEAGVSVASVSRVLNNGPVSEKTKAKVEAAIRKMNYFPNGLARSLITGHTMNIGVLTHSFSNNFTFEFVEAIEKRLEDQGFRLFLSSSNGNPESEAKYLASYLTQQVDGIIIHDPHEENCQAGIFREISKKVPVVVVHSFQHEPSDLNCVIVDQYLGMQKAMKYLLELGHQNIWMVRSVGYSQDLKESVWRNSLTNIGFPPKPEGLIFIPDGDVEKGVIQAKEAVIQRITQFGPPSAIFASNDIQGIGAQAALTDLKLRIPEDVSLLAHDNTILAEIGRFSSVDLKNTSVGYATVDLLLSTIESKDNDTRRVYLTPDIVHRGSIRKIN